VVGTASVLASLRSSATVVAAGLLHNAYEQGDFGVGGGGRSQASRREIRRVLSPEVEEYVSRFPDLHWRSRAVDTPKSKFRPASKGEALLAFGPSSMLQIPNRGLGVVGFNRLAQLVERIPCYWLEVGSDLASIPHRVDDLLAEAISS
jgi:hypothetical protein